MAEYTFRSLNVLVVEDEKFLRKVLQDTLDAFKFRTVLKAEDGGEAIKILKEHRGAATFPDLIISDLMMSPVDGALLLQWVRSSNDSPNRFMPFIMLSGVADQDNVAKARDLGVTDFLAKPFTIEHVGKKILSVIDMPRQFITTKSYFGPDRRRRKVAPPGNDMRDPDRADVTIVTSEKEIENAANATGAWIFRLPNTLKVKVGGTSKSGPGAIPQQLLDQASDVLERTASDFTDWAIDDLTKVSKLCDEAMKEPDSRGECFESINKVAHELRGQGGTFGYPMVSVLSKMLHENTHAGCGLGDKDVAVVKAHIDAMRVVFTNKISNDGGEIGKQLLEGLAAVVIKIHAAD